MWNTQGNEELSSTFFLNTSFTHFFNPLVNVLVVNIKDQNDQSRYPPTGSERLCIDAQKPSPLKGCHQCSWYPTNGRDDEKNTQVHPWIHLRSGLSIALPNVVKK
jgi:hypothetical protein